MGAGVTNIRVKKLALQLGRPLPLIIEALQKLGLDRYAHPQAELPPEHFGALQQFLDTPIRSADFGSMMQSMGVRPLGGSDTPSGRHRAPPVRRPTSAAVTAPQPLPPRRPASPPPAPPGPDRSQDLQDALESVRGALARTTRDLNRQTQARQAAEQTIAALRQQLQEAAGTLAAEQARTSALNAALEAPAGGDASLPALLRARGLHGPDEAQRAVSAMLSSHRFDAVISELAAPRRDRLATLLQDNLLLHCGRDDCPAPDGRPVVRVAEDRCELCGGLGLMGPLQDFSDALLLAGLTRVGLQGGPPLLLRRLETLLDRRVQLRFVGEGLARMAPPPQVLIRWLPGDRAPTLIDGVIVCTDTTLAGMLRRAAGWLNRG